MLMPVVPSRVLNFSSGFSANVAITNSGVLTGYTVINKLILPSIFSAGGNFCKLVFTAKTVPYSLNDVFIFNPGTSGNAYNSDGNQARVTFNGGVSGLSVPINGTVTSDVCAFAIDPSSTLLIGMNVNVAAGLPYMTGLGSACVAYVHASKQEAGTTLKAASYTPQAGRVYCNFSILVSN